MVLITAEDSSGGVEEMGVCVCGGALLCVLGCEFTHCYRSMLRSTAFDAHFSVAFLHTLPHFFPLLPCPSYPVSLQLVVTAQNFVKVMVWTTKET